MNSVYVAGHTGLVGSALYRRFSSRPGLRLITATRSELELTDASQVENFIRRERPEAVVLSAGRVGGILANSTKPAEFVLQNLRIEANLIDGAWKAGVKRLLNFGSSCMYPKETAQPMHVEQLGTGLMEPTSEPYAIAKWAGMVMCSAYTRQYGVSYVTAIPATVYGPGDNFDPNEGHVLSALINKFHQAKEKSKSDVALWGSGKPKREFLYVDDLAEACELLLEKYDGLEPINIGSGQVCSIEELAQKVADLVSFQGRIVFASSHETLAETDGAPNKQLESSPIGKLGWSARTTLETGLARTYEWFLITQGAHV